MKENPLDRLIRTRLLGPLALTACACFFLTSLFIYDRVTSQESRDLLLQSNDWSVVDAKMDEGSQLRKRRKPMIFPSKEREEEDVVKNAQALELRKAFEKQYPPDDTERVRDYVRSLRRPYQHQTQPNMPYDIYSCPSTPPPHYPMAWSIMDVINHWNPANTTDPPIIYQGLCVFDYETDLEKAQAYQKAELPFMLRNTPQLQVTAERWNRDPTYLSKLLGPTVQKVEHSHNVHFMYWKANNRNKLPENWSPPMDETKLSFDEWMEKAKTLTKDEMNHERWYFRLNGAQDMKNTFLYDELPLFKPKKSLFMVDPTEQRGINCRFGMKGVIAETHYDQSRNMITLLGGQRRYILAHPRECENMCLYAKDHPSGRHSAVDWTNPDLQQFPQFAYGRVNEVVLQAGDAMYLPTFWFHFIVSLNINYQCNARSGTTWEYRSHIADCGFL